MLRVLHIYLVQFYTEESVENILSIIKVEGSFRLLFCLFFERYLEIFSSLFQRQCRLFYTTLSYSTKTFAQKEEQHLLAVFGKIGFRIL